MPLIHRSTYPGSPRYLFNGHLQTIVPSAFRTVRGLTYERERLELAQVHPDIFLETPRTGGHVGFMVASDEFTWAERRALEFVKQGL